MKMKMFILTVAFICFCILVSGQQLTTDARAEQANSPKKPLFSEIPKYLTEDLLLYYSFDKSFSTKLTDLSGNGNYGKVHGVECRPEGRYGAAGFFNGMDNFVCVENVHLDTFTFAGWIKTSTSRINNRRVFLFDSGEGAFFAVQGAISGDMEFSTVIWQEGENEWEDDGIQTEDTKLQENTWTHIAVSFDGARAGIYFDGRLIQMKELTRDGFTGTLYLGGIEAHRGEFWYGMIDEVAIFKRALFAAEIGYLYDPAEDNPLVELKEYCESGKEWSPKLLDILQQAARAMQVKNVVDPNLLSGRGVAHFYEIQKESTEKDKWEQEEEERIIQFQFKGNSSRSDIFSGLKGKVKQLEWIFAENSEYGIRYDGDDLSIEDNRIGIFHRELGYDMHPDTFNMLYGIGLSEFLYRLTKWAKEEGLRPSVTISDDGILQLAFVHTATDEKATLQARMDIGPPARVLSLVETEENYDEKRTKEHRQYRASWQWHSEQCYVKDIEHTMEGTEFDIDKNPEQPRHRYMHQRLEVLAYESLAAIPDREFTLWGLPLKSDTDIWDSINRSEYSLDDVLSGRIRPGPRYKSLIGTKLPDLKPLIDDTVDPLIRDKAALICFFDMQQRPSRNCIIQIAKQVEQLEKKGVTAIAVHASKVDESILNEWVKKNYLPFPVGMIRDYEEKTRFNWGIKSLPWLILTDKEHNITAEGFVPAELDAKIKEIVPSASTPADSNKVTGLVKDPNEQVVSGVRVTEFQTDKDYTTDADGRFISAYGPSDERRFFFAVDMQRKLVGVGRLPPGETHVEIKLAPARVVSGTVVDPDGKPVAGAQVAPLPMTCFHVLTDKQGQFDVAWSPSWEPREGLCLMVRRVDLNLAALVDIAKDTENIEVKLTGALTLTGIVEDPNGKPISGAKTSIGLIRGGGCRTPVKDAITNNYGRFELYCLPQRQEYGIQARVEGFWRNQITTGIINRITDREEVGPIILKRPILTVSGIVVHANGKVVANIPVHLRGEGQSHLDAQTDSDGRFTFEKVCCGPIRISAKNDALFGKIETVGGAKNVKLVVRPRFE